MPRSDRWTAPPRAPKREKKPVLVRVVILAMIAGCLQSPLAALAPSLPGRSLLDDALVLLALVVATPRFGRAPGAVFIGVLAWVAFVGLAIAAATVPTADALVLARQVTMPAIVLLVGLTIKRDEWRTLRRTAIWIGLANVAYMTLELVGVRLLDPLALVTFNEGRGVIRNGLPSYYFYWQGNLGETITRVGGLLLNPPVAGLVVGGALALLWHERDFPRRRLFLALLAFFTMMTFARGGWLVAIAGIVLPILIRKIGAVGTIVLAAPAAWYIGTHLSEDGNSASHAQGLAVGFSDGVTSLGGVGFGSVGNYIKSFGRERASESLLGIVFSAAGVAAIVIVLLLAVALWRIALRGRWEACLALGVLAAAAFSETAGALNGTIPLWLAAGVALATLTDSGGEEQAGGREPPVS